MEALPPLSALRAFEAAARRLSFADAAKELHVTPAAVSNQIRQLEAQMGVRLFRRLTRSVVLTPEGAAALPALTEGFARLRDGVAAMRAAQPGPLSISVAPSLAHKWLAPRIGRFRDQWPDIALRVDARESLADFGADGVDLALRLGREPDARLQAMPLFDQPVFPVASPALAAALGPEPEISDLLRLPLLHLDRGPDGAGLPSWSDWLTAAGVRGEVPKGPRYAQIALALEAAIGGAGLVLASEALVQADVDAGRLVRPLCCRTPAVGAVRYSVVYPPERGSDPRVRAFRDWVLAEAGASGCCG